MFFTKSPAHPSPMISPTVLDASHPPNTPRSSNRPVIFKRCFMFLNIIYDFLSRCHCRLNRPSRMTKPIAYRPKSPRATGHLVKSTVDDHGLRPQATTTGDGAPGRPWPTTTTTGDGPLKRLSTNGIIKKHRPITEKTPLTNVLSRSASR